MDRLLERLAEGLVRRRARVAVGLGLLTALALVGLARLRVDDVPRAIFESSDPEYAELEAVFRDFGGDDNDCLVLLEGVEILSPAGVRVVRAFDRGLAEVDGIETVLSLADLVRFVPLPVPLLPAETATPEEFERARARCAEHPMAKGQMLSPDGRATILVARLDGEDLPISVLAPRTRALTAELDALCARFAGDGLAVRARLTGVPPLRVDIFETIEREQKLFTALGAVLGVLIGLAMFRRFAPMLVASGASALAGLLALGGLGLAGEGVNLMNASLPMLVMVIALTDSMHLVIDVLASRRAGRPVDEAGREAVRHLTVPCALTSLTTAIGFASLGISRVEVIRRFGLAFACAVALTFLIVLTAVPLLSQWLLRGESARRAPRGASQRKRAEAAVRFLVRHARAIAVGGVLATVGLFATAWQLVPDNRLTESTPDGSEAVAALREIERAFAGSLPALVLVEWPQGEALDGERLPALLGEIEGLLEAHPHTHAPLSPLSLARMLPGHAGLGELERLPAEWTRPLFRPDLRRALVSAKVPDSTAREGALAEAELNDELAAVLTRYPGFHASLTGTSFVARRNLTVIIEDFVQGLAMAAAIIWIVLALALRSWRLGALAVLPNVFPLVLAAASLVWLGLELQVASAIAFTVCLGIAVDDTIHLLARYRRERRDGHDCEEAVVRAVLAVGSALIVTTLVLLAGFGVLGLSSIPTTRLFAWLCTLGMVGALIGDLLLLPALIVVFDRSRARASRARS